MIIETVVRDGASKKYRILNLSTGTVYSSSFDSHLEAQDSIEHGQIRAGFLVKFVSLDLINRTVKKLFRQERTAA